MANAIAVSTLTHFALRRTRSPAAAWQCILLFFVLRLSAAVKPHFHDQQERLWFMALGLGLGPERRPPWSSFRMQRRVRVPGSIYASLP